MKTGKSWARPVGLLRALLECLGLGILLFGAFSLFNPDTQSSLFYNTSLFLNILLAFWLMLRVRIIEGKWGKKIGFDLLAALLLALLTSLILPGFFILIDRPLGGDIAFESFSFLGLISGPLFVGFRIGRYFWEWWQRKRQHKLVWELIHIQLSLIVLTAILFILAGILFLNLSNFPQGAGSEGNLVLTIASRLMKTILPYLGITVLLTLVALVLFMAPAALVSYLSVRRLTNRLDRLTQATQRLKQGDTQARIEVQGEDEIAQLQRDFNAMADDLAYAFDALNEEKEKVSRLLENRKQLTANTSHELRTPVATIQSYLDSLSEQQDLPETVQDDVTILQNEVQHLTRLIDDLFTLSQAEVGALVMVSEPVKVTSLVHQVAGAFRPLAWQSGKVVLVVEAETDPIIEGDPDRLEQALANLIRNAIHHTPPGGIISLQVIEDGQTAKIHIRDTGEGISEEDLPHIWERFYRGQGNRDADQRGAGLGLSLVRELVTDMGGEISVTSQTGIGTEFIMSFNLRQGVRRETTTQSL
jgi:signal transduction histidine kinase